MFPHVEFKIRRQQIALQASQPKYPAKMFSVRIPSSVPFTFTTPIVIKRYKHHKKLSLKPITSSHTQQKMDDTKSNIIAGLNFEFDTRKLYRCILSCAFLQCVIKTVIPDSNTKQSKLLYKDYLEILFKDLDLESFYEDTDRSTYSELTDKMLESIALPTKDEDDFFDLGKWESMDISRLNDKIGDKHAYLLTFAVLHHFYTINEYEVTRDSVCDAIGIIFQLMHGSRHKEKREYYSTKVCFVGTVTLCFVDFIVFLYIQFNKCVIFEEIWKLTDNVILEHWEMYAIKNDSLFYGNVPILISGMYRSGYCDNSGNEKQTDQQFEFPMDLTSLIRDFLSVGIESISIGNMIKKCEKAIKVQIYDQLFDEIVFKDVLKTTFKFDDE